MHKLNCETLEAGLQLPETQSPYDRMQYVDGMAAFVRLVEDNAASRDGRSIDVEQNQRIGDLVRLLDAQA